MGRQRLSARPARASHSAQRSDRRHRRHLRRHRQRSPLSARGRRGSRGDGDRLRAGDAVRSRPRRSAAHAAGARTVRRGAPVALSPPHPSEETIAVRRRNPSTTCPTFAFAGARPWTRHGCEARPPEPPPGADYFPRFVLAAGTAALVVGTGADSALSAGCNR